MVYINIYDHFMLFAFSEMGNAYIDRDVTDKDMADALVGIID